MAESARLTDERVELGRDALEALDDALRAVVSDIAAQPEVSLSYFVPDGKKDGGRYETVRGQVKKIDEYASLLILADGKKIPLGEIVSIERI